MARSRMGKDEDMMETDGDPAKMDTKPATTLNWRPAQQHILLDTIHTACMAIYDTACQEGHGLQVCVCELRRWLADGWKHVMVWD